MLISANKKAKYDPKFLCTDKKKFFLSKSVDQNRSETKESRVSD